MPDAEQVANLREETARATAAGTCRPVRVHDTAKHMSEARVRTSSSLEQSHQVGIGPIVVHQKTGIERHRPA